jgi:phage tail sheath protein FI
MPVTPTYPGVYIEELPSGVRTITGVATSITAFIGRARRGPVDDPVRVQSFEDYVRAFGDLWLESTMGHAVQQFFSNGGTDGVIVRVFHQVGSNPGVATVSLAGGLTLVAANQGTWGNQLRATVDHDISSEITAAAVADTFNLIIQEVDTAGEVQATETFRNVSVHTDAARNVETVLTSRSSFARVSGTLPGDRPDPATSTPFTTGDDGMVIDDNDLIGSEANKTGIFALEDADLFNLLCIPPRQRGTDIGSATRDAALAYCKDRRAFYVLDAPEAWIDIAAAMTGVDALNLRDENVAVYFPRVRIADPLLDNQLATFAPCGVVTGIYSRTDAQRGVWKAPAGPEATMRGVGELTYEMTDGENGRLNHIGVNCLRSFPVIGPVIWGARTLEGADRLGSEWKYVPVRRTALFIEETLYRALQWVVFEPNDEPLWAEIRLNVGSFMNALFRQGAFQGSSPGDAHLVKCDSETTTQADIDRGIVNILIGFAPLKPAEFVFIKIQQLAGQIQT